MAKVVEAMVPDASALQQGLKAMRDGRRIEGIAEMRYKDQIINRYCFAFACQNWDKLMGEPKT
jgi:hypothetical protein